MSTNSEWLKWRNLGCGSSDIASILGLSPWKTAHQLWKEKTGLEKPVDISNQYQVQRGVINEPKARALFELLHGDTFPPALAVHPKFDFMRVSLDGDNGESVLEIKCPSQKTIDEAIAGKVPDYYLCQVDYQMMCAGRKHAYFFCFNPTTEKYAEVEIVEDKERQAFIEKAVISFWEKVQSKTWEDETDFVEITEMNFSVVSQNWQNAKERLDAAKEELELAESEVLKFADRHKKEVRGFGIKILKSEVKGAVDYKKVPELKGVNLDEYRKASSVRTTIKTISDKSAE